jgi:DNA-binding PadR family transcriptional regulator
MERPMHPYEMKLKMKERGHDQVIRLKGGSIYDTVERLEEGGFITSQAPSREGRRPERTVYEITGTGRDEITAWLREMLAQPVNDYPQFAAALAFFAALDKEEVIRLLQVRSAMLERQIAGTQKAWENWTTTMRIPRLFLVEAEYGIAMNQAELEWVRSLIAEIRNGTLWITHEQMRAYEQVLSESKGGESG